MSKMKIEIKKVDEPYSNKPSIYLVNSADDVKAELSESQLEYVKAQFEENNSATLNSGEKIIIVEKKAKKDEPHLVLEEARKAAFKTVTALNSTKQKSACVVNKCDSNDYALAYVEGLVL